MEKSSNEGSWLQYKKWSCIELLPDGFTFLKVKKNFVKLSVNLQKIWLLENGCSCTQNIAEKFLNKINEFVVTTVIFYFT